MYNNSLPRSLDGDNWQFRKRLECRSHVGQSATSNLLSFSMSFSLIWLSCARALYSYSSSSWENIRCSQFLSQPSFTFSLFHRPYLNNTELKIFGRHRESNPGVFVCQLVIVASERLCLEQAVLGSIPGGDHIFLTLCCVKKACERERIHLILNVTRLSYSTFSHTMPSPQVEGGQGTKQESKISFTCCVREGLITFVGMEVMLTSCMTNSSSYFNDYEPWFLWVILDVV